MCAVADVARHLLAAAVRLTGADGCPAIVALVALVALVAKVSAQEQGSPSMGKSA